MKFLREHPPFKARHYREYREHTRRDFHQVCAYCFRHEEEAGGEAHFEQDHFKPKHLPDVDPADYYNLYWSCRGCNAPQNKGRKWPSAVEFARGEQFCDPCNHDPVGTDYDEKDDGTLQTFTPAGRYTDRYLRLSIRPSLVNQRRRRRSVRENYTLLLNLLRTELDALLPQAEKQRSEESQEKYARLYELADAYATFVQREPFMLHSFPPPVPEELITQI